MTVYVVTTDADSGAGSLRNALAAAQTGDAIEFAGSLDDSIITLQSSLTIADGVTIDGGGDKITISGDDKYTDFIVSNFGAGGPATLEGLTIANGNGVGSTGAAAFQNDPGGNGGDAAGGVMLSSGSLNLVDDAFNNDTATGGAGGAAHDTGGGFFEQPAGNGGNAAGALYVEGNSITASNLTFSNDTATPGQPGAPFPGEVTETAGSAYAISNFAALVDAPVFTVTTDADSGAGSLRAALAAATTYDIIEFAPSLDNSTITLQSSLTIAEGVTIDGEGDNITISGADKYTDFIVSNASTSEPVTLEGLTIANGVGWGSVGADATGNGPGGNGGDAAGGVMLWSGSLDLFDDAFNNDTATGGAGGAAWVSQPSKPGQAAGNGGNAAGAVYVELGATVTASNLTFSNDTAHPGQGGAGIGFEANGSPGVAYDITNYIPADPGFYTVTTVADSGVGSLRYALTNSLTGEIIKFAPTLDGQTITLQSSLIIGNGVTIDGLGDDITISGDGKYTDFTIFNAGNGPTPATLEGLTIADGNAVGSTGAGATTTAAGGAGGDAAGGLMVLNGAVNLVDDAFNNDTATGGAGGASSGGQAAGNGGNAAGAVYVEAGATVTATDLTFSGDTANAGQPGSNASGGGAGSAGGAYAISNTHIVDSGVYTVTTDADSGLGSLRAILAEARTGDWINFAASLDNSTIALQSSLTIADGVTIDGFGDKITISGDDKHTDFIVANAGAGAPAALEGLTIANAAGDLSLSSGAVGLYNDAFNSGTLTFAASAEAETFSLGAGARLIIDGGDTLSLSGTNSLSGLAGGAGTLALTGGTTTFATGAALSTAAWSLSGAGTTATLAEALTYAGAFTAGAGTRLSLAGGGLSLKGATTLSGLAVTSSVARALSFHGATGVSGLTIGGLTVVDNFAVATESGGSITVGDAVATDKAELVNTAAGTWDITDNSGVAVGADASSLIDNAGLIKKTGGTGTSTIAVSITDTGAIAVGSGTLAFSGPSNRFAGAITGSGGTVQFAGGSTSLSGGTTATVSRLSETGAGTFVALLENLGYAGGFTEGVGAVLDIAAGDTLRLEGTNTLSGTVEGAGALDLSGAGTTIDAGAAFHVASWSILGAGSRVTADSNVDYAGAFSAAATDTFMLSGGNLVLTGTDTFSGGTVDGSHVLYTEGATSVSGLTIGGAAEWENTRNVTQHGGAVSIGDGSGAAAKLFNTATGVYAITSDNGIGAGTSTASLFTNAGTFEKTGGTGTSTVSVSFSDTGTVTATSGMLAFSGPSNSFAGAITGVGGTVRFAGGATNLRNGTSATVSNLSETGLGTTVSLLENLGYAGGFTEGAGSVFDIAAGDTLTLEGTDTLSGAMEGAGALDISGGAAAIDAGAAFYLSTWAILGAGTTVTANANVVYAHTFSEAATDTFVLSGGYLALSGTDTFAGGVVDGSKTLYTEGTTSVSGLTIGGTVEWANNKNVTQNGGNVSIGDGSGASARLVNTATGVYAITSDNGIGIGTSASSSITNQGLFEKTGGAHTSTISPAVANSGTILVSSGTLDLTRAVSGTGTDTISGASTLEFDSAAALTQTIRFTGGGGTLDIASPGTFSSSTTSSAAISGFDTVGTNDTIKLTGSWSFVSFLENGGGTSGTLTLASGGNDIRLTLLGDHTGVFHPAAAGGNTLVTYT